jgi:signal transduction histidine kinase
VSRRWLILTGLAGLAILIPSVAAPYLTGHEYGPDDVPVVLTQNAVGASFLAVGWVAAWRRPHSRIGMLMMAVGLAWFVPWVGWAPNALLWSISRALGDLFAPVLAHVFVSFPSGRLRARRDRLVVALAYGWWLAARLADALTWHPVFRPPPSTTWVRNVFGLLGSQHLNDEITRVTSVASVAVVALVVGTVISHWRHATPPGRRVLAPVLWASVPTGVWVALEFLSEPGLLGGTPARLVTGYGWIAAAALPFGFLAGLLRTRLGRGAVGDLVVELGRRAAPAEHLDAALARVLGDPTIRVLYRVPSASGGLVYVDASGQPAQLPQAGTGQAVTTVDEGGEPVAALVHDAALADEPELLEATVAAARLAIDNARLQAEVRAQLEEVRASRARIVRAGDVERQRIERNLHDGAQQRLLALSFALRLAESKAGGDAELTAALGEAAQELKEALSELRELAQGLHPAILTRSGLAAAVRAAARRTSVPAEVTEVPEERFAPDLEAAAYYVVSEALANAGKHASATCARVSIRRSGGVLHVEVADDGVGGADPAGGSGLTGLADRVAALDGTLRVTSLPGAGTAVTAELPCGA